MLHFEWPWLFLLLPLPLLIYWLPSKKSQQTAALRIPIIIDVKSSHSHTNNNSQKNIIFLSVIWMLLILAVIRPQWLGEAIPVPTQGREMMIAVDLSGSMQIEDMEINNQPVNRLVMLKRVLGQFIQRRVGDRLGLILFADDAYMQTPMTFDRNTVQQMLDESVLGLVGEKTAIGDAIGLAVKRFEGKNESNRVLLLLTDGQNTAGKLKPEQALELAVAKDITIYTIGIGADVMLQRSFFGNRKVNPSADLDEKTLTNIAEKTGGKYFRARDAQGMAEIYQLLDQLEPIDQEQQQMQPLTALYYWPLGIAVFISFLFLCWRSNFFLPLTERNNG